MNGILRAVLGLVAATAWPSAVAFARAEVQEPEAPQDRRVRAIRDGVTFLVRSQQADGGMPVPPLGGHDRFADTAFAALALLAAGERMDRGEHHPALRSAVRWLQGAIPEQGPVLVQRPRPGDWQRFETWYVAVAGLLFAELQRQSPAPDLARTLASLRARIVAMQKANGGWCHDLAPRVREVKGFGRAEYSDDLCAVGCLCVAALDAMRAAGLGDEDGALRRGAAWLLQLQNEDGGFAYGTGHSWGDAVLSEPGRSAGALFALLPLLGREDPRCQRAARYLDAEFAGIPFSAGHGGKPFVVSYLHGAWCCAREGPAATARYLAVHGKDLLARQGDDGSFRLGTSLWDTGVIGTATAVLCLLGEDSALRCAAALPLPAGDRERERREREGRAAADWLRCRAGDGVVVDGRWGDKSVDLALTGIAAMALSRFDPLGEGDRTRQAARWAAAGIAAASERGFVETRRSHLGFQLPLVLPLLLDHRDEPEVARAGQRVVDELVRTQRDDGGWGYDDGVLYRLLATTAPIAIALCDARDAGLAVPDAAIERAIAYVEACQGPRGGFRYCPDPAHPILAKDRETYLREEVARTVLAVAALAHAGRAGGAAHAAGVAFLAERLDADALPADDRHLWFTLFWGDRLLGPAALRERWDALVAHRLDGLRGARGEQRWPGMAWSGALGRPPMYPVFATAVALWLGAAPGRAAGPALGR